MKRFSTAICLFAMAALATACGKTEFSSTDGGLALKSDTESVADTGAGDAEGELLQDGVDNPQLLDDHACGRNKVLICHVPPGNPGNSQTLCISENAIPAHLAHQAVTGEEDMLGACEEEANVQRCQSHRPH
jgi:hypothetical protein